MRFPRRRGAVENCAPQEIDSAKAVAGSNWSWKTHARGKSGFVSFSDSKGTRHQRRPILVSQNGFS